MRATTTIENSVSADYIVTEVLSDTYDDAGILREKCYRWLFRIWSRLNLSLIRTGRRVVLPIAPGTRTMMLPHDCLDIVFLGLPDDCGNWIPIAVNRNLMPQIGFEGLLTCKTCGQPDLCSLNMSQVEEQVVMDCVAYPKTTTRVIQADGSYTEEVTEPVKNYTADGDNVIMQTSHRVVCNLEKTCEQCVAATPGNVNALCGCGCAEALCGCCSTSMLPYDVKPSNVHYNLFEQEGFIQFSSNCCLDRAFLWYVSSGHCVNGIYYFPIASMETLISGVYFKSIEKKKNVTLAEKERARRQYTSDRKELLRDFTKLSYQEWRDMIDTVPRIPTIN